jgi:hypothetical protein
VSRQDVLDRPSQQRAQSLDDLLPRHALGQPALQELDAVATVDERVADGDSAMALDPEQDVVRRLLIAAKLLLLYVVWPIAGSADTVATTRRSSDRHP